MTVDPRWIRGPSDELAVRQGCYFDASAGEDVCDFLEAFCRQSKGRWAGDPLRLLDWQRDFLMRLHGWMRPSGRRRFREGYLEVPKKNGKSTLISGLALYHLVADSEAGAEVYCCAVDKEQASIVFGEADKMVESSPDLSSRLERIPSQKTILHPGSGSKLKAQSADVPSKDGLNASATFFDELHRQKTASMWRIYQHAGATREQPLLLAITTAGDDLTSICRQQHDYAVGVNTGTIEDTSFLGIIYCADASDDLDDPAVWAKANPSLGQTLDPEEFRRALRKAQATPSEWHDFLRLRFNIWAQSSASFLPIETWQSLAAQIDRSSLRGRKVWGGLDLSTTTDLSALAWLFSDGTVLLRAWLPQDGIQARERKDKVPYRAWADAGWLTLTPGPVIDYQYIRRAILADAALYDVVQIAIDPHNATQLAIQLGEDDGIPVEFLRQGFLSLNQPTKELERLVLGGELRHEASPVMARAVEKAIAETDAAGNYKLSKKKSTERIDPVAALVNAVAARLTHPADDGPSDDQPFIFI